MLPSPVEMLRRPETGCISTLPSPVRTSRSARFGTCSTTFTERVPDAGEAVALRQSHLDIDAVAALALGDRHLVGAIFHPRS